MTDKEQMELDEAVRTFAGYVRGDNGFDELDFKEWLLDWRDKAVREGQRNLIEAVVDLFVNPPVGAAEDTHYHPHQIRDMLNSITDEMLAELHPSQRPAEKEDRDGI